MLKHLLLRFALAPHQASRRPLPRAEVRVRPIADVPYEQQSLPVCFGGH